VNADENCLLYNTTDCLIRKPEKKSVGRKRFTSIYDH